jgi:Arylsulfotransferase (ASST)
MNFSKLLSIASFLVLFALACIFATATVVSVSHNGVRKLPTFLSNFAYFAEEMPKSAYRMWRGDITRLHLVSKKTIRFFDDWTQKFPALNNDGFILFSGFEKDGNQAAIKLIRIFDGAKLIDWNIMKYVRSGLADAYSPSLFIHPILMPGGDIVTNLDGHLIRITACADSPVWTLGKDVHHSIELDADGNLLTLSLMPTKFSKNQVLAEKMQDNGLLRVSAQGKVLQEDSFSEILLENGFKELLLGHFGLTTNVDPLHLNQVSEAQKTTPYWNKGDLLISSRHLSSIFLYRPSTRKILWHQSGPWLNQHSAAFLGDSKISVLNNNVVSVELSSGFVDPDDVNEVIIYDFATQQFTQPYKDMLEKLRPQTATEGRAQITPDGNLFFEETNNGRMFETSATGLLWSYINSVDANDTAQLRWSRYYSKAELMQLLPKFDFGKPSGEYNGCVAS